MARPNANESIVIQGDGFGRLLFRLTVLACLTAGVMGHNANMRRFQKLGDMVLSAVE